MKLLSLKSHFLLFLVLIALFSCRKDREISKSFQERLQGTWSIQEVRYGQTNSSVDSTENYLGVTLEFRQDSMIWNRASKMEVAKGSFEIKSEEVELNPGCDDFNEDTSDDCECETRYTIYSKLYFLKTIYVNSSTPVYVTNQLTGESKIFDVHEIDGNESEMTWLVWQNSNWYTYKLVKQ